MEVALSSSTDMHDERPAISVEGACILSTESWRLSQIADSLTNSSETARLLHAVRRISDALKEIGIEVVNLAGRNYDPGMVPEVIEVQEDQTLPTGLLVIAETVEPTVIWRGRVIKPGKIIVKRGPIASPESIRVGE